MLCRRIARGDLTISKNSALTMSNLIRDLDRMHLDLLKASNVVPLASKDTDNWIKQTSSDCHPRTPMPERTLYAAIQLQLAMLDRVLYAKDQALALRLRNCRNVVKIRDKDDRFFGDARDYYVSDVLRMLERIGQDQSALGITGTTDWRLTKDIETQAQLEAFIIAKVSWVRERSRLLLSRRNGAGDN